MGVNLYHDDPTTAALENQNSLPDEKEEKHPASILGCSSFFSFLTGFPAEGWGDKGGICFNLLLFFSSLECMLS
jgi:hypothetical protein